VTDASKSRIGVRKTYKLYIGGAFPRSESGHSYPVHDSKGTFVANAALASRKDARDAVVAARKAFGGWSGRTAYNRAQILYRVAELMEDRRPQFVEAVCQSEGLNQARAEKALDEAIDRLVWYAGWADKITHVVGSANPVAGPFFNLSTPEPTGVVAVLAPQQSSLLGLVSVIAPAIVTGNTVVVVSSYDRPLPAVTFSEVLATADLPGGVVNILTGSAATVAPWLASHMDVNALDLCGAADAEGVSWGDLEAAAADNLKRVLRPDGTSGDAVEPDWRPTPGLERVRAFLETKTVWHPKGT
jgi:acyl-CoA reductase-like NAD-dependent aldehyde dehydrogenase